MSSNVTNVNISAKTPLLQTRNPRSKYLFANKSKPKYLFLFLVCLFGIGIAYICISSFTFAIHNPPQTLSVVSHAFNVSSTFMGNEPISDSDTFQDELNDDKIIIIKRKKGSNNRSEKEKRSKKKRSGHRVVIKGGKGNKKSTATPTPKPTSYPTAKHIMHTTAKPTNAPTSSVSPTKEPTMTPTQKPSKSPTKEPTLTPTQKPSKSPTKEPTLTPTQKPSKFPSKTPTIAPSSTMSPTKTPSMTPTKPPVIPPNDYRFVIAVQIEVNATDKMLNNTLSLEHNLMNLFEDLYLTDQYSIDVTIHFSANAISMEQKTDNKDIAIGVTIGTNNENDVHILVDYMASDPFRRYIEDKMNQKNDDMVGIGIVFTDTKHFPLDWSDPSKYTFAQCLLFIFPSAVVLCLVIGCGIDCYIDFKFKYRKVHPSVEERSSPSVDAVMYHLGSAHDTSDQYVD
eukprot:469492_1